MERIGAPRASTPVGVVGREREKMKRMSLLLVTMLVSLNAQTPACPAKTVPSMVTVEVRERSVDEPVSGLAPGDFQLSGKGIEAAPVAVKSGLPADIVVLIEDRSRGGLLAGAWDLFVKSLLPEDRVAVMTYGTGTKRQVAFTSDKQAILKGMQRGADGWAMQIARPFYGVVDALKLFDKPVEGRQRAIFMLGDDQDNGSQIRVEQLAANLIEERVSLDLSIDPPGKRVIPRVNVQAPTVGNEAPAMRPASVGRQSVTMLAEATGGRAEKYVRAEFFEAMRERLKKRATVTYCVEKKHSEKPPRVELSPAGKGKYPNAEVFGPGIQ